MLFRLSENSSMSVHNLSHVKILPPSIKIILFLGLKFSILDKPNYKNLLRQINEGKRKLAWRIFFELKGENKEMDRIDKILFNIKKDVCPSRAHSPIENYLFCEEFTRNCINKLKNDTQPYNKVHTYLINDLKLFIEQNKLVIKQSDKNAGICIMNNNDYKIEICRQLSDENTYRPSVWSEFLLASETFRDKASFVCKNIIKDKKIKTIFPRQCKPAKFYILPKVHKAYDKFPVGRPISSTLNCMNRGVSMILDSILQPLSLMIPDLIIDSPHLLLLLNNLQLNADRKYILCTADIQAMYLELPITTCKENCLQFFTENRDRVNLPLNLTPNQLKLLLDLTLNYSFVQFGNEMFVQHRGIQMGNCSSVSIANITAAVELRDQLSKPEIVFKGRFIDDILMIIDITDLTENMQTWLDNIFKHKFLKFTYEYSDNSVNFLDLSITLNSNNVIATSLYRKPMSKHEFVHFLSSHPSHLLRSLPYSCGLRIIRACSGITNRQNELSLLMEKFKSRNYPFPILENAMEKLKNIDRIELLKPKSSILIQFLSHHNPAILVQYGIEHLQRIENNTSSFVVVPFYKNINYLNDTIKHAFVNELSKCTNEDIKKCIEKVNIIVAFSIPNSVQRSIDKFTS